MSEETLTVERVRELLDYDSETGVLTWKVSKGAAFVGRRVDRAAKGYYYRVMVDGKRYFAHRLIWFWVHGKWPDAFLDHINRCKTDNRLTNLRPATGTENNRNVSLKKNNQSGFPGVFWSTRDKKWAAYIRIAGKGKYLGTFADINDAAQARARAEKEYFGAFAP